MGTTLKQLMLFAKLLSVLAYSLAMAAVVMGALTRQLPQLICISQLIQLGILAFVAYRFWQSSGRPVELDEVAILLMANTVGLSLLMIGVAQSEYEIAQTPFQLVTTIFSECLSLALLFGNFLATRTISSDELRSIKITYFVLRSFAFDVVEFRDQTFVTKLQRWLWRILMWVPFIGDHAILALSTYQFGFTFESLLRDSLDRSSAVAATVYNPAWKKIPPVIGTLLKVRRREDWTEVVRAALCVTSVVVALPGSSAGLRTEIEIIRSGGISGDRLVVPLPQSLTTESVVAFSSLLIETGFDLSQVNLRAGGLYTFSNNWVAIEIASGIETAEEAAKEILAWMHFRSRPAPQWCEFDRSFVEPTALGRCSSCGLILDFDRVESVWPEMGFLGRVYSAGRYDPEELSTPEFTKKGILGGREGA